MCPSYALGSYPPTGCVATAMAQIMFYHKWPSATKETIEGYTNRTQINGKTLVLDDIPAGSPISWEYMKTFYEKKIDLSREAKAVAELMKYCTTAIKVNFGENSSSASTAVAADMLKQKFGYTPELKEIYRSNYSLSEWLDVIYNELKEGRPVLYGGDSSTDGHAFIVDGYNGDELFHINWGWGGNYDGNYLLTVANPFRTDGINGTPYRDGFSNQQSAIINIRPDDGNIGEEEDVALTFKNTSVSENKITYGTVQNFTGATNSFEFTIAKVNNDATLTPVAEIKTVKDLQQGYYIADVSFIVTGLPEGTHKIVPVSRKIGTDKWIYNISGATEEYVEAHVDGNKTTLYAHLPSYSLEVSQISFPGTLLAPVPQPVNVLINNHGDEFYGGIYLFASTTNNKGKANGPFGITVTKEGEIETTLFFTPQSAGKYNVWVTTDEDGNQVIGQSSVNIQQGSNIGVTSNLDIDLTLTINKSDKERGHLFSNNIDATILAENPTSSNYVGLFGIKVYCYRDNGSSKSISNSKSEVILAGARKQIDVGVKINSLILLMGYKEFSIVPFYVKGDQIVEIESYKDTRYTIVPGMPSYTEDGEIIMIPALEELTVTDDMTVVDLRENSTVTNIVVENPNCLFIINGQHTPITGMDKNIIIDGVAEEVILSDGHPFYTPIDFVAKKISYTRIFDIGAGRTGFGGWNTIVLPFDVQKVSVETNGNERVIDWFRSNDDTMKNFWMKEFYSDSQKTLYYAYLNEIVACRPYLINVPNSDWGNNNDLTGKPITFSSENVNVSSDNIATISGDFYKMKGVFRTTYLENIYVLDEEGKRWVKRNTEVLPFRAYIVPTTTSTSHEVTINMGTVDVDHISNIQMDTTDNWFTVTGIRIDKPTKSGVYINKGKKIVIK